ncbi:MAG: hypothetical protein ACREOY_10785 [Candidatus Dormibacteraceae bacterium]
MDHLGGPDLAWPRDVVYPQLPNLPLHPPMLVQIYGDFVDVPWAGVHGDRLLGVSGRRLTPKHPQAIREVYHLASTIRDGS